MYKNKLKELVMASEISRGLSGKAPHQVEAELKETVNIKDFVDGRVDTRNLEKKALSDVKDLSKVTTREGDVLVAVKGSSFKTAIVDTNSKGRVFSSNIISLRLNEKIQPEILVAYLNSIEGQHDLDSIAKGTSIPSISTNDLLELTIPVPSEKVQISLKKYLNSVDNYLATLHKEEELVKKIKDHLVFSFLGEMI